MNTFPMSMSAVPEACGNTLADSRELSLIYPKPTKIQNLTTQKKKWHGTSVPNHVWCAMEKDSSLQVLQLPLMERT